MRTRAHKSYKLKDDSVENLCEQLIGARIDCVQLSAHVKKFQQQLLNAEEYRAELEKKVIYLMQAKHKKSCTVNRVHFELDGDQLKISLVLD